jgi:hypothetical protein
MHFCTNIILPARGFLPHNLFQRNYPRGKKSLGKIRVACFWGWGRDFLKIEWTLEVRDREKVRLTGVECWVLSLRLHPFKMCIRRYIHIHIYVLWEHIGTENTNGSVVFARGGVWVPYSVILIYSLGILRFWPTDLDCYVVIVQYLHCLHTLTLQYRVQVRYVKIEQFCSVCYYNRYSTYIAVVGLLLPHT